MSLCETGKTLYKETKRIINDAMTNDQLVLFVGAGVSADSGMPLWREAIPKIAEKMQLTDSQNDILKIPQYYYNSRGKKEYTQLMRDIFRYGDGLLPTKLHKKLLELQTTTIITTNYDHLIEQAAEENGEFIRVISQDIDMPYRKSKRELIKMHGDFEHDNFVLKEDDYLNYSQNFKLIEAYVKSIIGSKVVLFVGYSLSDPDVKHIISWVKEVLKDDFQRAYLILTKTEPNYIEKEYFGNLGINLIYGSELVEQSEVTHSEQLIEVLDFLICKEEGNKLDVLYEELKPLEDLNYVYGKYIFEAFRKHGIICGDDNTIDLSNEGMDSSNKPLMEAIWSVLENKKDENRFDKEKIASVIRVCEKSRFCKVIKKEGNKYVTSQIKNKENGIFENMIFRFDYEGLYKLLEKNNAKLSLDNPDLYMQQAYICAFLNDYYNSYNYFKIAAHIYYVRKSYAWYFIAEFNRKYVGRIAISPYQAYELPIEEQEKLELEVKTIDLNRILDSIPGIGNDNNVFLQELNNFTISYTLFYDVYADSLKTNEQATTAYSLFAGKVAYESLRIKIKDFERYETSNYIILDNYKEIKSIFDLYIRTILSSINALDITMEYHDGACRNIKADSLTDFDLYIVLRYMQRQDLINYFKEYGIKKIPLSETGVLYLNDICKSICNESKHQKKTIFEIDKFWTYLELISHINISDNIAQIVFERLLLIKNKIEIISYEDTIGGFIRNICDEKLYDNKEICKLAKKMVDIIVNFVVEDKNVSGIMMSMVCNLLFFINKGNFRYDNVKLINKLVKGNRRNVLFYIYPYLIKKEQDKIKNTYKTWIPKMDSSAEYYQYCNGVLSKVLEPSGDTEKEILQWILNMIDTSDQKNDSNVIFLGSVNYMDVLKRLIDLFLDDKIINVELLRNVVEKSDDEMSKWLLDLEKFDYGKFDCSWLMLCKERLIKLIVESEVARKSILNAFKEQYDTLPDNAKICNIIVQNFI